MELSKDEMIFAQRMLPHFIAGKSVEDAARAVLGDDIRLLTAFCARSHDVVVGSYSDHSGCTVRTANRSGDVIAAEITALVYERLRAA